MENVNEIVESVNEIVGNVSGAKIVCSGMRVGWEICEKGSRNPPSS